MSFPQPIQDLAAHRGAPTSDRSVPDLVGQVYDLAPPAERGHILEQLLQPLGVLSLVAIAGGVFAKIRFRAGWGDLHVRLEDTQHVGAREVAALVDHVQQVSIEAVAGLAQWISASPLLAGTGAAALLLALLMRHARSAGEGPAARGAGTGPNPDPIPNLDADADPEPASGPYADGVLRAAAQAAARTPNRLQAG